MGEPEVFNSIVDAYIIFAVERLKACFWAQ